MPGSGELREHVHNLLSHDKPILSHNVAEPSEKVREVREAVTTTAAVAVAKFMTTNKPKTQRFLRLISCVLPKTPYQTTMVTMLLALLVCNEAIW